MSSPTRREFLRGPTTGGTTSTHISSAVISVLPAHREALEQRLAREPGVEIHHRAPSKLVVVLEGETSGALGAKLAEISGWPGVLSANMVFEQALDISGDSA